MWNMDDIFSQLGLFIWRWPCGLRVPSGKRAAAVASKGNFFTLIHAILPENRKWKCQGFIQSGTHELTHFALTLTHGAGGAMLSCLMLESAWPLCSWLHVCNPTPHPWGSTDAGPWARTHNLMNESLHSYHRATAPRRE